MNFRRNLLGVLATLPLLCLAASEDSSQNWPQWRGPLANGASPTAKPPTEWSETKNIKWKVPLPGTGSSTPIIWENQVFILSAVPTGKKVEAKAESKPEASEGRGPRPGSAPNETFQFVVLSLDRQTGNVLWKKVAKEAVPHEGHHQNHGFASASPVTDGKRLYAYFGSRGLHCYDLQGNLIWEKDFGQMKTKLSFGEASSPALGGDALVVNWDDEGNNDFIVALDKTTGKELWRTPRNESTTWSTPLILEHEGQRQVVVNATGKVRSYDLASGKQLWECAGQTVNAIPSPVAGFGMVYVMSGFRGNTLHAIRLGKTGDLAGTDAIAWSYNKATPYVPSPLLYDGRLYFVSNNSGMLSCFDAKTGRHFFEAERLNDVREIYASPAAANDKIYIVGRDGTSLVLKPSTQLEIIATNKLDDHIDASPAFAGKELFLRGRQFLYCIAEQSATAAN